VDLDGTGPSDGSDSTAAQQPLSSTQQPACSTREQSTAWVELTEEQVSTVLAAMLRQRKQLDKDMQVLQWRLTEHRQVIALPAPSEDAQDSTVKDGPLSRDQQSVSPDENKDGDDGAAHNVTLERGGTSPVGSPDTSKGLSSPRAGALTEGGATASQHCNCSLCRVPLRSVTRTGKVLTPVPPTPRVEQSPRTAAQPQAEVVGDAPGHGSSLQAPSSNVEPLASSTVKFMLTQPSSTDNSDPTPIDTTLTQEHRRQLRQRRMQDKLRHVSKLTLPQTIIGSSQVCDDVA